MGTDSATTPLADVTVRRAKRADLAQIFVLIQRASQGQLVQADIVRRATGYGYLMAEARGRLIGVAGILVENSIVCVRDMCADSSSMRGLATLALANAIETEAGRMACDAVLAQAPPSGGYIVEALLRSRHYERKKLSELNRLWLEVAKEQFDAKLPIWVYHLREWRRS